MRLTRGLMSSSLSDSELKMTFSQKIAWANEGAFPDTLLKPRVARSLGEILGRIVRGEIGPKTAAWDAGFEKTG